MPGNTIKINDTLDLHWYVGDSKIEEVISWLNENGEKIDLHACECAPDESCEVCKNDKDSKMNSLEYWAMQLVFPGKIKDFIKETKNFKYDNCCYKEFSFYTYEYKYRIYAIDRTENNGYLSCQVSARKARAGEDWIRGNDLIDGSFTKTTWNKILNSIVNYELVKLSKFKQPDSIPSE
jgi:hypothetical protein